MISISLALSLVAIESCDRPRISAEGGKEGGTVGDGGILTSDVINARSRFTVSSNLFILSVVPCFRFILCTLLSLKTPSSLRRIFHSSPIAVALLLLLFRLPSSPLSCRFAKVSSTVYLSVCLSLSPFVSLLRRRSRWSQSNPRIVCTVVAAGVAPAAATGSPYPWRRTT